MGAENPTKTRLSMHNGHEEVTVDRIRHCKHVSWMYRLDQYNGFWNMKELRVSYDRKKGRGQGRSDYREDMHVSLNNFW